MAQFTRDLIDKLLLERWSLAAIVRITGISERWSLAAIVRITGISESLFIKRN
jgi:hypothetical protein